MMIRGLNSIYLQAPHIQQQDEKAFLHYCACFYDLLQVHHRGEEEDLFPQIEAMAGEKGMMDQNVQQHQSFHHGLEQYNAYITACLKDSNSEKYDSNKLVGIIDTFGSSLVTHLTEEIATILNLAAYGDKMTLLEKRFEAWANKDTVSGPLQRGASLRSPT